MPQKYIYIYIYIYLYIYRYSKIKIMDWCPRRIHHFQRMSEDSPSWEVKKLHLQSQLLHHQSQHQQVRRRSGSQPWCWKWFPIWRYIGASQNCGTPKSSILIGFSLINSSILGYPYFWKHPCVGCQSKPQESSIFGGGSSSSRWDLGGNPIHFFFDESKLSLGLGMIES